MATHHIARQRIVLEASGVDPPAARQWYARLERLQETRLLPALQRTLDRIDDPTQTIYIDRLEVTVQLDDTPAQLTQRLERALHPHLAQERKDGRPASLLKDLLYFLRSGNLPPLYPDLPSFRRRLSGWEPSPQERIPLLRLAAVDIAVFLGRGARVRANFRECSWRWLATVAGAPFAEGYAPAAEQVSSWWEALEMAGFWKDGRPRPWKIRRTGTRPTATPPSVTPAAPKSIEEQPAYYPENAGLVLLHAYLPHLLQQVECPVKRHPDEQLSRAATLLHYLAHGNTEVAEWQLPLTKLLLGLHPDDYLMPATTLTDSDRETVDELLRDVIVHWEVLKNTHIDSLRTGFLQRPGKLEATSGGWQLTVERRAHDVLLDRLPWSIALVKTPWMRPLLQVTWA